MKAHAVLSPSKSSMWINCPPSARLGEKVERKSNYASDEGTLAHDLCELLLKKALNRITKREFAVKFKKIQLNKLYNKSMLEHCEQFAVYVIERYNGLIEKYSDAMIFLETELDLSKYIPEGFGTGDVIIIAGQEIHVIDFKFGSGVFVVTENNSQMMIYAIGAIDNLGIFDDINKVVMTIYQPRLSNIDSWEISYLKLMSWVSGVLISKAKLAFAGKGKLNAGSHCQFCPVKATCKVNADYNLMLAGEEFDELSDPYKIKDADLVGIYLRAKGIRSWLAAVEDYMLEKAIHGKNWKGLKLVHGRSIRVLTNPAAILKVLQSKKLPAKQYMSEPQLLGITALESNIGAQMFAKLAGKYIAKPKGKPSLVHADNKGQIYDVNGSAKDEFKHLKR